MRKKKTQKPKGVAASTAIGYPLLTDAELEAIRGKVLEIDGLTNEEQLAKFDQLASARSLKLRLDEARFEIMCLGLEGRKHIEDEKQANLRAQIENMLYQIDTGFIDLEDLENAAPRSSTLPVIESVVRNLERFTAKIQKIIGQTKFYFNRDEAFLQAIQLRTESTEWQRDPKSLIGPNSATGIRVDAKDIALVAAALCPPNQEPRKYIPAAIKLVVESASYLDIENKHLKMASENSLDMVNYNRPEALACLQIRDERTLHKYLAKYLPAVKSEGEWEALRQERKIPRLVLVRVKRDIAKNKLVRARAGYRGQVKKEQADLAKYGG